MCTSSLYPYIWQNDYYWDSIWSFKVDFYGKMLDY